MLLDQKLKFARYSPGGDVMICVSSQSMRVFHRRRPEWWWGVFYLKELWLAAVLTLALLWSVRRDWKGLAR